MYVYCVIYHHRKQMLNEYDQVARMCKYSVYLYCVCMTRTRAMYGVMLSEGT